MRLCQIWGFPPFCLLLPLFLCSGMQSSSPFPATLCLWEIPVLAAAGDLHPCHPTGLVSQILTFPSSSGINHFLIAISALHGSWAGRQSLGSSLPACQGRRECLLAFPFVSCECWALAASLPARSTGSTWNCCIVPVLTFPDPISPSGCDSRAEGSRFERQELLHGALSRLLGLSHSSSSSSSSSSFQPGFAVSHVGEGDAAQEILSHCAP